MGKPDFPIPQPLLGAASTPTGRGMGKPGFPVCSPQSSMRLRRTTPEWNYLFIVLGRAKPSQTLPRRAMFTSEVMRMAPNAGMKITILGMVWEGFALPNHPCWRVVSWEGVGARRRRAPTPKPSCGRAMFTSESGTPCAFVYSFPIRWPISPPCPGKPIPEQVKPVEGLHPPKPSHTRPIFTSVGADRGWAIHVRRGFRRVPGGTMGYNWAASRLAVEQVCGCGWTAGSQICSVARIGGIGRGVTFAHPSGLPEQLESIPQQGYAHNATDACQGEIGGKEGVDIQPQSGERQEHSRWPDPNAMGLEPAHTNVAPPDPEKCSEGHPEPGQLHHPRTLLAPQQIYPNLNNSLQNAFPFYLSRGAVSTVGCRSTP